MRNPPTSLVRAWKSEPTAGSRALAPLGWPWAVGATLHRKAYDWGLLRRDTLEVPVVSVGNLVVGGAGKTPVTLFLAQTLIAAGRRVAVASRGYGRKPGAAVVLVSDGEAVRATADEGGDEPVWLAHRCPGLIVTVSALRVEAARAAIELGADLVLLDDGFSHHRLARRDDVLVVDDDWKLGNGLTLPAGPLREPARAGRRASMVWLTKCRSADALPPPALSTLPVVRSRYDATGLVDLDLREAGTTSELKEKRVVALCGIARPAAFEQTLQSLGASVREVMAFPDHHRFTDDELAHVASVARSERADLVITTEKDAMRLAGRFPGDVPARALRMDVQLLGDTSAFDALVRRYAPGWQGLKQ